MSGGWTYAHGVHPGSGKATCQDVCAVSTCGEVLIAAVADGAGSAAHAEIGARIVAQTFIEFGQVLLSDPTQVTALIDTIRFRVEIAAQEAGSSTEEFSSTLVGAVIGPDRAAFLQVGDGAAMISDASGLRVAIEPEVCEFVNSTRFVTSPRALEYARYVQLDGATESVALFSDGLQHLLLDAKNEPHRPFFDAAFRSLRGHEAFDLRASAWVEQTLGSDPVVRRTDDDTSLVIARRLRLE
jgi:hypothetical protein